MRTLIAVSLVATALTTLLGCEASVDFDQVQIGDFATTSDRVCIPPQPDTAHSISIVGPEPVTVTGVLKDEDGQVIERGGVDVALWSLQRDSLVLQEELAAVETNDDGTFSIELDPTDIATFSSDDATLRDGLGFLIDGEHERWLSPTVQPRTDTPAQITCAYWAFPDGTLTGGARMGDEIHLVVRAIGTPPSSLELHVREVGSDLSGDETVARITAEPFDQGVSETVWTLEAEAGFLDGNGVELQFSVTSPEADYAFYGQSAWLYL